MALKQTEDQVKQMRDEALKETQARPNSVRSKIANKVSGKTTRERAPSMVLSDQDIKAALNLVDESWGRQEYRLQQYLQRNYNIANGISTTMDVDDEEFERPDTATSLGRIVEKVTFDSTPTVEKDVQLGGKENTQRRDTLTPLEKDIEMSFSENMEMFKPPPVPSKN